MSLLVLIARRARALHLLFLLILAVMLLPLTALAAYADTPSGAAALSLADLVTQGGVPALIVMALVSFAASLFCAVTPTPASGSRWAGLYQLVELVAVITRHTKQTGIPAVDALNLAAGAIEEVRAPAPKTEPAAPAPGAAGAVKQAAILLLLGTGLGVGLVACAGGAAKTGAQVAAAAQSPAAQSLITGMNNYSGPVGQVVQKINQGLTVTQADKQMVCGGMSWANAGFQLLAPKLGASPSDVANEQVAMTSVDTLCSGNTGDLAGTVATVAAAYQNATATLQQAGVPVTAPAPVAPAAAAPAAAPAKS